MAMDYTKVAERTITVNVVPGQTPGENKDDTMKWFLILGAAAVAAYFLWFRKK